REIVGAAAGAERDHEADRARRVGLRACIGDGRAQREQNAERNRSSHAMSSANILADANIRVATTTTHHKDASVQHFNASDGLKLAYTIDDFTDPWLKVPTLLLLHAAMGHSQRYYAWVPRLSRHYRVVRMDLRGHGESEVPPAEPPLTMERLVQDTR